MAVQEGQAGDVADQSGTSEDYAPTHALCDNLCEGEGLKVCHQKRNTGHDANRAAQERLHLGQVRNLKSCVSRTERKRTKMPRSGMRLCGQASPAPVSRMLTSSLPTQQCLMINVSVLSSPHPGITSSAITGGIYSSVRKMGNRGTSLPVLTCLATDEPTFGFATMLAAHGPEHSQQTTLDEKIPLALKACSLLAWQLSTALKEMYLRNTAIQCCYDTAVADLHHLMSSRLDELCILNSELQKPTLVSLDTAASAHSRSGFVMSIDLSPSTATSPRTRCI